MEKLKNLIEKNPKFKRDETEYLRLAIKDEKGVVRGTGPHRVKLLGCENAINREYKTGKEIKGVNLIFEEGGVRKKYFVPILGEDGKFHYLIHRFADIEEGTELILEYKRREGRVEGYIDVQLADEAEIEEKAPIEEISEDDDIPIVEEDIISDEINSDELFEDETP